MISSRKRKWKYKSTIKKRVRRLSVSRDGNDIRKFVRWCEEVGIRISKKVSLTRRGSCANIGMVARRPITEGTCLAKIPRTAVLCCSNSKICDVIRDDSELYRQLPQLTSWLPLMLSLLYERDQKDSYWRPYLDIVPNDDSLLPPLLWTPEEREGLLAGTSVAELVQADHDHMMQEYTDYALPFMTRHSDLYSAKQQSIDQYSMMVGFVMSYSFSDARQIDPLKQTLMMPVIDLLNHHSRHHAELTFEKEYLLLTAIRDIRMGEEIMNTYGQLCNASLVHMYGFAERDNPHNMACVPVALMRQLSMDEAEAHGNQKVLKKRWKHIVDRYEIVEEDEFVEVSLEDLESFLLLVKILHASTVQVKPLLNLHSIAICDLTSREAAFAYKLLSRCLENVSTVPAVMKCPKTKQEVAAILRTEQASCLQSIMCKLEGIIEQLN